MAAPISPLQVKNIIVQIINPFPGEVQGSLKQASVDGLKQPNI